MAKKLPHPNIIDIAGQTFFNLTALNYVKTNHARNAIWNFVCNLCGKEVESSAIVVKNGSRTSCGCGRRLPDNLAAIKRAMSGYISRAKSRQIEFSLTFNQFKEVTQKPCHYCYVVAVHRSKSRTGVYHYNGIDRKNNLMGYTAENSLPCCSICNSVKGRYMSELEMKNFMTNVKMVGLSQGEDPWKEFRNVG